MWTQHIDGGNQTGGLHVQQKVFRRPLRTFQPFAHHTNSCDGSAWIQSDRVRNEVVGRSSLNVEWLKYG